jgi:hypothetical protein
MILTIVHLSEWHSLLFIRHVYVCITIIMPRYTEQYSLYTEEEKMRREIRQEYLDETPHIDSYRSSTSRSYDSWDHIKLISIDDDDRQRSWSYRMIVVSIECIFPCLHKVHLSFWVEEAKFQTICRTSKKKKYIEREDHDLFVFRRWQWWSLRRRRKESLFCFVESAM